MDTVPSLHRRPLPPALVPFSSEAGRQLFREALDSGHLESFFPLIEQFHTQSDPAFCGLGSLVMVLNALGVDPGRVWRGPWRWFSEELLDCCTPLDSVRLSGLTLDQLTCLARCNGARVEPGSSRTQALPELRTLVESCSRSQDRMLIASYSRAALAQTGAGHFSPLGGYHAGRDMVLLLDVARFKYPPHWVPLPLLYEATREHDPVTGRPRGWLMLEKRAGTSAVSLLLTCSEGLDAQALLARLVGEHVAATASAAAGLSPLLQACARALSSSGLGELVRLRRPEGAEQRGLLEAIECWLTGHELYRIAHEQASIEKPAALVLWCLAAPDLVWAGLEPGLRAELKRLLDVSLAPTAIAAELELLRSQVELLLGAVGGPRATDVAAQAGANPDATG